MHFVFLSSVCSPTEYKRIVSKRKINSIDSSQYFYSMFLDSLSRENKVDVISFRPISSSSYDETTIDESKEFDGNTTYYHLKIYNFFIIKSVLIIKRAKKVLKRIINKDTFIICDGLNLEAMSSVKRYLKRNKNACFLTDLPVFASQQDKKSFFKKLIYKYYDNKCLKQIALFEKHIVLTNSIADYLKLKNYLVVECFSTKNQFLVFNNNSKFLNKRTVVYAGKLHKEFGLDILLESLQYINEEFSLDLYGEGNYVETIKQFAKNDKRIRYNGIVQNEDVKRIEANAFLLINPRTSQNSFTKYSFPSKTAEYLSSGTPVVMFKLPGVPSEYYRYVFSPEEETPQSLAKTITAVFKLSQDEYSVISNRALHFMETKSADLQTKKIIDFILH